MEQLLKIPMKQERTKDCVRLLPWVVLTMNSQQSSSAGYTPHEMFHWGRPAWFFKTLFPEDYKSPLRDWLEHKPDLANLARANLKHVRECELSGRNRTRRPASCKVGDLVLVHHSRLPSWLRNCLQDPFFGPYRIIRIDGSTIHVRCSPHPGGELLCAPKQLRRYHSPYDLSWDKSRLSDKEVERIDLENATNPEEADELEEVTTMRWQSMATTWLQVLLATSINRVGNFLTLWNGYGLSEATWEPMSAFVQPDGTINPFFRFYLVENNEGQLLTRAETLSQRKKYNQSPCAYLLVAPNRTEEVASFKRRRYFPNIPSSRWESPSGHSCRSIGSRRRYTSPSPRKATLGIIGISPGRLSCLQPYGR